MIKEHIAQLMDKKMDRKSFLVHSAAAFVAVFGASAALKMLSDSSRQSTPKPVTDSAFQFGYGGAPYGR